MYLNLEPYMQKKVWIDLKTAGVLTVREIVSMDDKKKPILDAKGKPIVKYAADIVTGVGITVSVNFDTEAQAEKFLQEKIIDA